jgi:hypothetical protein
LFNTAAEINNAIQNRIAQGWQSFLQARLTRKGQQDAAEQARKQNELGWATLGLNTAIGGGNAAAPYGLATPAFNSLASLTAPGIPGSIAQFPFDNLNQVQLEGLNNAAMVPGNITPAAAIPAAAAAPTIGATGGFGVPGFPLPSGRAISGSAKTTPMIDDAQRLQLARYLTEKASARTR